MADMSDVQRESNGFKPLRGLFLIIAIAAVLSALYKWMGPRERIPWSHDVAAATQQSGKDGKPVLLYFTASWCGPCQQMAGETWVQPEVETALRAFRPVKIDIDRDQATAQRYEVRAVPTFVLLDKSENVTKRTEGFLSAEEFLAWIGQ